MSPDHHRRCESHVDNKSERLSTPSFPSLSFVLKTIVLPDRKKKDKKRKKSQKDESLTEHDRHGVDLWVERAPPLPRLRPGVDVENSFLWPRKGEVTCFIVGLFALPAAFGSH